MTSPAGGEHLVAVRRALKRAAPAIARPLPWVGCGDPWAIVVSEFMLQQTQTSRVIGPWQRFLERFPTPADCAGAPLPARPLFCSSSVLAGVDIMPTILQTSRVDVR